MPGQRAEGKTYLGWWAPAEAAEWVKGEAARLGRTVSDVLGEALSEYRGKHGNDSTEGENRNASDIR